jgi:large subunit ribosomal protein L21
MWRELRMQGIIHSMNAVIKVGGSQHLVSEGQLLEVNRFPESKKKEPQFDVLLAFTDTEILVGKPILENIIVKVERLEDKKGIKVRTFKYKAKSRYRKTTGFRPQLSVFKIVSISQKKGEKKS